MVSSRAFDKIVDFITSLPKNEQILAFKPSIASQGRMEELLEKKQLGKLNFDENREIEQFLLIEHLMRAAKARARKRLNA